jgi:eight-cysteine-cluster-containing protein
MSSTLTLPLIILAVLVTSLVFLVRSLGGFQSLPDTLGHAGVPASWLEQFLTESRDAPSAHPFISGNSRFSLGRCTMDSECVPSGCSGEVCTSTGEVTTTCEFSESFPNAQGLTCGCVNTVCGWR